MINSKNDGYGVVYTPDGLADFTSQVLLSFFNSSDHGQDITILDPACGEGSLLTSISKATNNGTKIVGVDIDKKVIDRDIKAFKKQPNYTFLNFDAILPQKGLKFYDCWKSIVHDISAIIANPPWSSEKLHDNGELKASGYDLNVGQYDAYVLFIEMCMKILNNNGVAAFILPDSLFSGENKKLRQYLSENFEIKMIARLGEKLFTNINRATMVLILKKSKPKDNHKTTCFRLNTQERKMYLEGKSKLYDLYLKSSYLVSQKRFKHNDGYNFDIDVKENDEKLLDKIKQDSISWNKLFHFGRGVEVAKSGNIVVCQHCGKPQGFSRKQQNDGIKRCISCSKEIMVNHNSIENIISAKPSKTYKKIFVGENVRRYAIVGEKYIKPNMNGINYKDASLYVPPKLLVRKTGLGINACIDTSGSYISQTVYSCHKLDSRDNKPLAYYLAVLNSRLIFYYYLKVYGENEWKSHPYITKDILFSIPIKRINEKNKNLCLKISEIATGLMDIYDRQLDLKLEDLIMDLYDIKEKEKKIITNEINSLPNLGAINHMKY